MSKKWKGLIKKSKHLSDRLAGRVCTASFVQVRQAAVLLVRPELEGGRQACPTTMQNLSVSAAATILRRH